MQDPYLGITDFTSAEQVRHLLAFMHKHRKELKGRRLHVGAMTSYKVLSGRPSRWASIFPPLCDLPTIFSYPNAYNCLHYVDHDALTQWKDITTAIDVTDHTLDAIQLDMAFPDPGMIAHGVHSSRCTLEVILQVGRKVMEMLENDPVRVADYLEDYGQVISRVLLDKSMGGGIALDPVIIRPMIVEIHSRFPDLGIGIAGRLGPDTMEPAEGLLKEFPFLSTDAQSQMHPNGDLTKPISMDLCERYIMRCLGILNS